MQYHIVLTEECNLNCTYCGGTRHIPEISLNPEYSLDYLRAFLSKDPEPVIGFYGGEPLLAMEYMYQIMDTIPAKAYTLQTNGTRLSEIDDDHLHRLHSILVSIDGNREVTDSCRGEGTHDLVMKNLKAIQDRGYKGDIVARMAFSDGGDIYRNVNYLLNHENPRFDHVHWQLDIFWTELERHTNLEPWLQRYEEGISNLVTDFGESMKDGNVLGIVPFIPVFRTLLTGTPTPHIRCGSGANSFSIMTSGRIDVCPIAPELEYSAVGNIYTSDPENLRNSLLPGPPCSQCEDLWVCGGRCLFSNQTKYWGDEWFNRICGTTRHMIHELEKLVPLANKLIESGTLIPDSFNYPELNNGCEIIP